MRNFSERIYSQRVKENQLAIFWLGQAGFLFKTSNETLIAVDPYLSNCCERYFGFKRLMSKLLDPNDIVFDWIITTHAHYDHFDIDAMPLLLSNGHTRLISAIDGHIECKRLNLPLQRITYLKEGKTISGEDFIVKGVPCDHGELAPDALGLFLTIGGKKIYITGDTCFCPDLFKSSNLYNPDLLILPINGAFGNLNEHEAALTASLIQPKLVVPCHFWNFAEHGGNPGLFAEEMKKNAPDVPYSLMQIGGCIKI